MAAEAKILKGYVKTENMILWIVLAIAVGFVGGVLFSVYRFGHTADLAGNAKTAAVALPAKQNDTIAALVKQTQAKPDDTHAWTQLANLYFDSDEYAKAIAAYEKSLSLDAKRPDVWTDLGVMYRRNGQPRKAVEAFDHALSISPGHQTALFNKGVVLMHDLKDQQGALKAWETLLLINPQARTPNGQTVKEMVEALKKNGAS